MQQSEYKIAITVTVGFVYSCGINVLKYRLLYGTKVQQGENSSLDWEEQIAKNRVVSDGNNGII